MFKDFGESKEFGKLSILDRVLQIKTFTHISDRIVFVDDINKTVLKRRLSQSLDGESIYFGELKPFPYSHHIN